MLLNVGLNSKIKKILLIENHAFDFYNSRLSYAHFLQVNGYEVYAMIPGGTMYSDLILQQGIKIIEYDFVREKIGILKLIFISLKLRNLQKKFQFDVIHSYRFLPNLINSLGTLGLNCNKICHITGLGIAFSNKSIKYTLYRFISQIIFGIQFLLLDVIIVQNENDLNDIWVSNNFKRKSKIILGSGIDVEKFNRKKYNKKLLRDRLRLNTNDIIFVCVSRLIWEKGIEELVEAFDELCLKNSNIKLLLAGTPDLDNPRHVLKSYTNKFNSHKNIIFLGQINDVAGLLVASDVFIYPSYYREGIPRSLLEALSMGLPIITTNMPGCRLAVEEGLNGKLIEPKSILEIIRGVESILKEDLENFGKHSRDLAVNKFQDLQIFREILNTY